MDVTGQTGQVIVLSVDNLAAELGADPAGTSRHRQGAVHKALLTIDLRHDPRTSRIAHFRHFYSCRESEIVGIDADLRRKEGIEIDLGIIRIDLAGQKGLPVQAKDTLMDRGVGMDI